MISKQAHGQKKYQRVTVYRLQTSEKTAWKILMEEQDGRCHVRFFGHA